MQRTMSITIEAQITWETPDDVNSDVEDQCNDQHKQQIIQEVEQCLVSTLIADKLAIISSLKNVFFPKHWRKFTPQNGYF